MILLDDKTILELTPSIRTGEATSVEGVNIEMHWEFVIALVIAVPIILFPAVLIWHMNIQGMFNSLQKESQQNEKEHDKRDLLVQNLDFFTVSEEQYED